MENNLEARAESLDFGHIGWRYYNKIRKKAMEQKFSWSGLFISLSIAFFIVVTAAFCLNFLYTTVNQAGTTSGIFLEGIFSFESVEQVEEAIMQADFFSAEKIERIERLNLA